MLIEYWTFRVGHWIFLLRELKPIEHNFGRIMGQDKGSSHAPAVRGLGGCAGDREVNSLAPAGEAEKY